MAGRTESEALDSYLEPLRSTLACITNTPLVLGTFRGVQSVLFDGRPPAAVIDGEIARSLSVLQGFTVIQLPDESWKVRTEAYVYIVKDGQGQTMFAYDWHPHCRKRPHLHIKSGAGILKPSIHKKHFPTGRIALEQLAWFLIEEMGVHTNTADWQGVLQYNLGRFEAYRQWA